MFAAALGITQENADVLETALRQAVRTQDAEVGFADEYGQRYTVKFEMKTDVGNATVVSAWIIRSDENFPRLVTAYIP